MQPVLENQVESHLAASFGLNPHWVASGWKIRFRSPGMSRQQALEENKKTLSGLVQRLLRGEFQDFPEGLSRTYFVDYSPSREATYSLFMHELLHDLFFTPLLGSKGRWAFYDLLLKNEAYIEEVFGQDREGKNPVEILRSKKSRHDQITFASELFAQFFGIFYTELGIEPRESVRFDLTYGWDQSVQRTMRPRL